MRDTFTTDEQEMGDEEIGITHQDNTIATETTTFHPTTSTSQKPHTTTEEPEHGTTTTEEIDDNGPYLPPKPRNLKFDFILYAVNSINRIRCTDISKSRSLYRKKDPLYIYIRGTKQHSGKHLTWHQVQELKPRGSNFINMVYVKGHDRFIPARESAIILMHFLKCLKNQGAEINNAVIGGEYAAKRISKYLQGHKHWFH